ncbi:hypothetical protein V6N12_056450 [Hibiscus sabdariffa]|uniref:Uncharacterized protein n=1 Tax=Hibiscus sabdariffa TaxID=183260 RepID=A0ABR2CT13_9ROSI
MNPVSIRSVQDETDDGDPKTNSDGGKNGRVADGQVGGKRYSNSNSEINRTLDSDVAMEVSDQTNDNGSGHSQYIPAIRSQAHLPKPEKPKPRMERSQSLSISESMPSIGKYIMDRSTSFSAAVMNSLSSLKEDSDDIEVTNDSLNFERNGSKIK